MKKFQFVARVLLMLLMCSIYKSAWATNSIDETASFSLTEFSWKYNTDGKIIEVTVCTSAEDLSGETMVYTLLYYTEGDDTEQNYDDGSLVDGKINCVVFEVSGERVLLQNRIAYKLIVDNGNHNILHGTAEFAVITETRTRDCEEAFPLYYRIEGAPNATFEDCIKPSDAGPNVCYKDNSGGVLLAEMTICYTDGISRPPGVKICQMGLVEKSPIKNGEGLLINYLAYGGESSDAAAVKLDQTAAVISEVFVVVGTNKTYTPVVCSSYDDGLCTFIRFQPRNILYSVCGLVTVGADAPINSINAIKDFDVFIYADTGLLLDFGFANANDVMWYTATLLNAPEGDPEVDTVNIDCTKVDAAHNCYGFLVLNEFVTDESYLKVSYNDETGGAISNNIIVPHKHVAATPTDPPKPKFN